MPRARRVHITRDPRFNLSKHGRWVEVVHTGQTKIGRIAYFDNQTLLYNVAGMEDRQWWGGQYEASQIRLLDYQAEPWYTIGRKKGRSDLTVSNQSIIIDPSRSVRVTATPSNPGGDVMARRKAVEVEEEEYEDDDLDDLDDPVEDEDEAPKRRSKAGKKGPASKSKKDDKPRGIGARQVAERLEVDGKTFRAWLRRQVAAGELDMNGRAEKERYDFGPDWSSPLVQRILKAWKESSHDKGAGLKKAQATNAAKREAAAKAKGTSKKAPAKAAAKKAAAKKSR